MSAKWTSADVPDQSGRVVIITGSNTGVGYEAAAVLADKGAHVVLAVRNVDKGKDAKARITATSPNANVTVQELDLASLASVRKAADELRAAHPRIDLLINNAGVMTLDKAGTEDGFELQFGTNHLGHFALTGLLLENMLAVSGSRVVTMSSPGHRILATIDFDHLTVGSSIQPVRRLRAVQARQSAVHLRAGPSAQGQGRADDRVGGPPWRFDTELLRNMPGLIRRPVQFVWTRYAQSAAMGALPPLRAATDPNAQSGQYYGPDGRGEQRGHPKVVDSSATIARRRPPASAVDAFPKSSPASRIPI